LSEFPEQKAREVRDTFDPIRQLQRRLESQSSVDKSQIDIATAVDTMPLSNFFEGKQFRQFVVRSSTWVCTRRLVPILSSRLGQIAHFCNSFRTLADQRILLKKGMPNNLRFSVIEGEELFVIKLKWARLPRNRALNGFIAFGGARS